MRERNRQDSVLALCGLHFSDHGFHRLLWRAPLVDDAKLAHLGYRMDVAGRRRRADVEQLRRPFAHIDMRVFLEQHQSRRVGHHLLGDRAMKIQFAPNDHVGADELADPGQHVTFAIVVSLGGHGSVHRKQNDIDGHRCFQIRQDLIAVALIDGSDSDACRLSKGGQALNDLALKLLRLLPPHVQGQRRTVRGVPRCIAAIEDCFFKGGPSRRHGRERVRLRSQTGNERFHLLDLPVAARRCSGLAAGNQTGLSGRLPLRQIVEVALGHVFAIDHWLRRDRLADIHALRAARMERTA